MGEVVVTATRTERSLSNVPASVSVVTSEQIQDMPAQGLDDVLRQVPGMTLTMMGPYVAHPTAYNESMRGLPTTVTRMLVLVDGVPINDPFFGYIQWNRIPLNNIDRVEIVRGGGAPLWGNGALGGVVNVITRTPEEQQVILDGAGGSYATYRSSAYGTFFPTDGIKLSMNAAFAGTDGYQTTPPSWNSFGSTTLRSPVYTPTSLDARNIALRGDFKPTSALSGFAEINYHENHQVLSTPIGDDSQWVWSFAGGMKGSLDNGASVAATIFHSNSNFVTDNPHLLTTTTEYDSNIHKTLVDDSGGSLIWSHQLGGVVANYALGADFRYISGTDRANYYDPSGQLLVPTIVGGGEQIYAGAFAEASVVPIERLEILASLREQYYENFDGIDTFPPAFASIPVSRRSNFDPRVDVRYSLTDQLAVRGAYYRAFRAPTLDQLYRTYADTTAGIYEGSPSLKPETLEGGEVGFDFDWSGLRSQLTFYTTDITNLVTQRNLTAAESPPGLGVICGYDPATFTYLTCTRNINAASARARGVELEVDWDMGFGFSSRFAYTFADSRYTSNPIDPTAVGERLEGVPEHNVSGSLSYAARSGWRAAAQLRYVTSSYGDAHPEDNLRQDAHFVVDASAAYPVWKNVQAYVQVQNLFDKRYIANNGGGPPILGTPFEALGGVRVTFDLPGRV